VMLVLQNTAAAELRIPGVPTEMSRVDTGAAKFDLAFEMTEHPDGRIGGLLEYATDLFDAATAAGFATRLVRLLEAVATDPAAPLGAHDILAGQERHSVLTGWNDTAVALEPLTVPELFARRVAADPGADAVVSADGVLSAAELDARAGRLARLL